MKKVICFILALLAFMGCFATADADNPSFEDYIPCKTTNDIPVALASWTPTSNHYGKIYIYHTVKTAVKKKYNNLFYAESMDDYSNPYLTKWCTPGVNRAYTCSKIIPGDTVYVSARGNTYYHDDNSSITQIKVKGSVGWPK